jgi:hypothetical protein
MRAMSCGVKVYNGDARKKKTIEKSPEITNCKPRSQKTS